MVIDRTMLPDREKRKREERGDETKQKKRWNDMDEKKKKE